jgi:transposase
MSPKSSARFPDRVTLRQIFGQKSERFAHEPDPNQMHLGETFPVPATPAVEHKPVAARARRTAPRDLAEGGEELPFFDESKVPVRILTVYPAEVQGMAQDQFRIICEKITYRIAAKRTPHGYRLPSNRIRCHLSHT